MASPDTPFCFYCEEVGDDDGDSTASETAAFRLVRTVRLLRLVKLLRILRASRIITRWQVPSRGLPQRGTRVVWGACALLTVGSLPGLQDFFGFTFAALTLMKLLVSIFLMLHWCRPDPAPIASGGR